MAGNPDTHVSIFYDDTCRLCSGIVEKLEHSSQRDRFEPVRISKQLPQGITAREAQRDVYVVEQNGAVYRGADAVLYIVAHYPQWRWLATLGKLPGIRQLFRLIYRIIADNRRWLWKTDSSN